MKRWIILGIISIILTGYITSCCIADRQAEQLGITRTEALLAGDVEIQFERLEISYQQRQVDITDPDTLRYIERCFREGKQDSYTGGSTTYLLRFRFVGGGTVDAIIAWKGNRFHLYMPYQETDVGEKPRVHIRFKEPLPQSLANLIDFLNSPWQEVQGKTLTIESGSIRRD